MQMIQHSSIPITSPLQSTSPQENYSSSDSDSRLGQDPDKHPSTSSPSAASSSSSSHRAPTAGAGRSQGSKPFEQELNSLGSIADSPRTSNKRAKLDQVNQNEEEDDSQSQSASSSSKEDARRVFRQEEEGGAGQIPNASAPPETAGPNSPGTLPAKSGEPLQNPGRIHGEPDQILSPTGYILGFLPSSSRTPAETPASSSSASAQQAQTQLSPTADSDIEHRLMPPDFPESSSDSARRQEEEEEEEDRVTEGNADEEERGSRAAHARSAAVRLLLGFMGALQASQYAVDSFVNNVVQYYRYTSQTAIVII